jgi:hypothetical protein
MLNGGPNGPPFSRRTAFFCIRPAACGLYGHPKGGEDMKTIKIKIRELERLETTIVCRSSGCG